MAAHIDPTVATILDRHHPTDSDDEDALIASLETEEDDNAHLSAHRENRLAQLHAELSRAKSLKTTAHGTYQELRDESELLNITTTTDLCVVHFFHPDFHRCGVMSDRLRVLAEKHFDTRFIGINVEHAPFVVVKLGVKVLPCVIAFKGGVGVDRIIGFEGLGGKTDGVTVRELEARLLGAGVLVRKKMNAEDEWRRVEREREERKEVYDDDDGWD
ncbi:hypothetical protein B0A50_02081 [Salinomyces thailandicus]|uniref:Thioredoxin-like protein n=1 Tax=Salinomyces thailandicus TaxID=706561 RepID=A0A4U0U8W6_9PEZI|nr:hypothetical protein B0A50_02081 [Salinomyces thailandica]